MQPRPHLELGKLPEGQQRSRAQKWSWKPINNSSRSDNLQIFHWHRDPSMTQAENEALPFAPVENIEGLLLYYALMVYCNS